MAARNVYSVQFVNLILFGSDSFDYVVPDAYVAVLRAIDGNIYLPDAPGSWAITADGTTLAGVLCPDAYVGDLNWRGHAVLPAGTTLTVTFTSGAGVLAAVLSGYLLTLP